MPQKDIPRTLRSMSGDTRLSTFLNTIRRKGILEAAEGRKGEGEWGSSAWHPPNDQCSPNKTEAICKFKSFLEQETPFQEHFFFLFPPTNTFFLFFFKSGKKMKSYFTQKQSVHGFLWKGREDVQMSKPAKIGEHKSTFPWVPHKLSCTYGTDFTAQKMHFAKSFSPYLKSPGLCLKVGFFSI